MNAATTITDDLLFTGRVTVVQRSDDFMAYLDGDTRRWESGQTPSEAIGKLVISHGQAPAREQAHALGWATTGQVNTGIDPMGREWEHGETGVRVWLPDGLAPDAEDTAAARLRARERPGQA